VFFFQHDLACDHALGEMHLILCRNVIIYFGAALRERALGLFAESLCHGGHLCLGASECLPSGVAPRFVEVAPAERIYRRRGPQ
jgi:chemotaxis protein methyltransferase CheR